MGRTFLCAVLTLLPRIASAQVAPSRSAIDLFYPRTGETLRVLPGHFPAPAVLNRFLRSPKDRRYTLMDPRLVAAALQAARRFGVTRVIVVSAFRSRAINEEMRASGRGVALRSRHLAGQALDLSLPGVPLASLCDHFRSRRLGGVGCYPGLGFVHIDVGPVRFW